MPYEGRMSKDDFDKFEKYVTSAEYKEKSEKAKKSAACNKYPHTMGRKSYARNESIWHEEGYYDSSSTSSVGNLPDRSQTWILGRCKKDDKGDLIMHNEMTQKVKENIELWRSKVASGEFQPNRTDDVLNRSLGRKEHSGRALGYGSKTTVRDVFGSCHRSCRSQMDTSAAMREYCQNLVKEEVNLVKE